MFEPAEISDELYERLKAAGVDPHEETVQKITSVVSAYFAERTAEVLTQVQQVLESFNKGEGVSDS